MFALSPDANRALRSLLDCAVIRTCFDHEGFFELLDKGLVKFRVVPEIEDALDWYLCE